MKLIYFAFLLQAVSALVVVDSALASSCIYYMKGFDWGCGGTGQGHAMYMCRCYNVDWLGLVTNCMVSQSSSKSETLKAWLHLSKRCLSKAHVDYSISDLEAYYTNASSYLEYPTTKDVLTQVFHPLSVNTTAYAVYKKSFNQINHHVFKTQWFGWGLVFFWAAYVAVFTVANLLWTLFRVNLFPRTARQWFNKHLMVTTFFSLTRFDLIVNFLFIALSTLSTALSYTVELPNMYINDGYLLTLDLIGYRSAILSFSLMPVVFIFGLRNNPFCFMTGLTQSTFIRHHKIVAIVMCIEAMIHSAVWTAYGMRSGPYSVWAVEDYWRWGIVGTVLIYLMLFHSMSFFRKLGYETFLFLHKIFGWTFIVSMWYHCYTLGWMGWVYSLIALTAYDRVMRLVKTFVLNRGYTRIAVSVLSNKIIKVTIPKSEVYNSVYKPGTHVYLSFYHWPLWYQCLQSHPFTVVSSPVESPDVVSIYFRVKRGSTRTLASLKGNEKGVVTMWALIDGPYGNGVHKYGEQDTVVGVAGGLGLCSLLPTFYERPQGSRLFWVVKHPEDIDFLHRELDYLSARGCDVRVFLKRGKKEESSLDDEYKYVTVVSERPDVDTWIGECCENMSADMHVLSCGPGSMDDDVERSVSKRIVVGLKHSIRHQRENFQW